MLRLAVLSVILAFAAAIPVDNGVEGDPEIECGPTSITVNFNTQNNFEGHVYVKGLYATPGCRNDDGGRQVAGITLPFDSCGVNRVRSLNPKGVFVSVTVIISFHPLFLTKVDRAYRIQCYYMEADKTVDTNLEVSMLTTDFQSQSVPMPVCRYEILDGGPTGEIIEYAIVGQQVYHKWTCDTETVDTFCMVVYGCYVDDVTKDGNAREILVDDQGCATDAYLLNNLEYPTDLMAGVEAHVFKYADRPQLYFQCQISILVKEPGSECPRPACAEPAGRGGPRPAGAISGPGTWPGLQDGYAAQSETVPHGPADDKSAKFASHPLRPNPDFHQPGATLQVHDPAIPNNSGAALLRLKRSTFEEQAAGVMDVSADLNTLDIEEGSDALPSSLSHRARRLPFSPYRPVEYRSEGICFSGASLASILSLFAVVFVLVIASCTYIVMRQTKN